MHTMRRKTKIKPIFCLFVWFTNSNLNLGR